MQSTQKHVRRSPIKNLFNAQILDDDPASTNSSTLDTDNEANFTLYLNITSTLSPTNVQFIVQFSNDGGTTWLDYKKDEFVSLFYEDVDTASGLKECVSGQCVGSDFRLRIVGTGTDATNFFTVTADVEFWS